MERYGYARVSTGKQATDSQIIDLIRDGVSDCHIVHEIVSGATGWKSRPLLRKLIRKLRTGDTLTVAKLDRLGRNAVDVLSLIEQLNKRGISVRILNFGVDTSGSGGKLFLLLLAGFAEFERNLIRERVIAGLETAREKGVRLGRRPKLSRAKIARARYLRKQGFSVTKIGLILNVSRMTVWRSTQGMASGSDTDLNCI
ncbi:recombinase family protein [Acetobacter aceti]|uniref:DNA-invertase n=1 Tax=Acetobacter aceti TaxID=435 RepID=A0A6S6PT58_ACEAC|nr:recombinase family protein [Acetobacter aceti]BCI68284.1 DNA-invertase [Acetobacter aceti]